MSHVLHLIRDPTNRTAIDVIAQQATDPALRLTVVLLQNAVHMREPLPGDVYRLDEGQGLSSNHSPHPSITHAALLELIFRANAVVTW